MKFQAFGNLCWYLFLGNCCGSFISCVHENGDRLILDFRLAAFGIPISHETGLLSKLKTKDSTTSTFIFSGNQGKRRLLIA